MEEFQDQLRSSISTVFCSLSSDQVNGIIASLYGVGVESLSDLEFVREEDLKTLKPVQRRKLIKSWTTQSNPLTNQQEFHLQQKKKSRKQNKQKMNPLKWKREWLSKLCEIFSEHKMLFHCPVKVHLWQDIARGVKMECFLDIDFIECYRKIFQLMYSFLTFKRNVPTTKREIKLYNEMRNAFEIPGDPDCLNMVDSLIGQMSILNTNQSLYEKNDRQPLKKIAFKRLRCFKLLQIFSKYKMEFRADVKGEILWKDIAVKMNRSCSLKFDPEAYRMKICEIFGHINLYTTFMINGAKSATQVVAHTEIQKTFNMVLDDANDSATHRPKIKE